MTDEEAKLERQLREATRHVVAPSPDGDDVASRSSDHDTADPEVAALAEGWQALGQLLAAVDSDFQPEIVVWRLRRRRLRERLWRGAALAAAALLLLGVGIAWYANRGGVLNERPSQPQAAPNEIAAPANRKATDAEASSQVAGAIPPPTDVASAAPTESGWDQTLDQQLSAADETVRNARTLANAGDDLIDQLDKQLVSFRQEVEADSL